jgi:hypothetical protein
LWLFGSASSDAPLLAAAPESVRVGGEHAAMES